MLLYLANVSAIDETLYEACLSAVPEYRKQKALGYKSFHDKVCCDFSYLLLKAAFLDLGQDISGFHMKSSPLRKPYFEETRLHFSISHSYPFIAAAISEGNVGIDIEATRKTDREVARRFFTLEEFQAISSDSDFLRLWTLKEAISKCTGEGIPRGLEKYHFENEFRTNSFFDYETEFSVRQTDRYILSTAGKEKAGKFLFFVPELNNGKVIFVHH